MIKVPKVGVQLFERQATLHLHVQQYIQVCVRQKVQVWGNTCMCYLLIQHWVHLRD